MYCTTLLENCRGPGLPFDSPPTALQAVCGAGVIPNLSQFTGFALKRFAAEFGPYGYELGARTADGFLLTLVTMPADQLQVSEDDGCAVIEDTDGHQWRGPFSTPAKEVLEVLKMRRDAEDI